MLLMLLVAAAAIAAVMLVVVVRDDREWKRDMERRVQFLDALERMTDDR